MKLARTGNKGILTRERLHANGSLMDKEEDDQRIHRKEIRRQTKIELDGKEWSMLALTLPGNMQNQ